MSDLAALEITYPNSTAETFAVGDKGVKSITKNGWSPEPYCAVSTFIVRFLDGNEKTFNQAYAAYWKTVPLVPSPPGEES